MSVIEFAGIRESTLGEDLFIIPEGSEFRVLAESGFDVDCVLLGLRPNPPTYYARYDKPVKLPVHSPVFFKKLLDIVVEFSRAGTVNESLVPLLELLQPKPMDVQITFANYTEGVPSFPVPRHSHLREHQIDYFVQARGRFWIGGVWEEISDGNVFYVPPANEHAIEFDPTSKYHNLSLKWIPGVEETNVFGRPVKVNVRDASNALREAMQRIIGSYLLSEPIAHDQVNRLLGIIEGAIGSAHPSNGKTSVARVKAIIANNYSTRIELPWVAAQVGLSTAYLSRIFRRETGTTFANHLRSVRLTQSRKMLVESKLPVTEIAKRNGFRSLHYFSQAFKNEFGVSPREIRSY
jgi:AraC-like DNA-binding protein